MPSQTRTELACLQSAKRDAKQRTAEIIAEVEAKYQPQWDALESRWTAAKLGQAS